LYDLRRDPHGVNNLAHDLAHAATVAELRQRLVTLLRQDEDPRILGRAAELEAYAYIGGGGNKAYDTWLKAQEAKLNAAPAVPAPARKGGRKAPE
jgi:hypothetical protein